MKQIRLSLCILCVILLLSCCSCGFFGDQKYVCDADAVKSIQIVRLDERVKEEYRYNYTVLSQIEDVSSFVDQLNNLKHSVNWGEPSTLEIGYVVIRIDYLNGDYHLLYPNAQLFHRSGANQYGYFFFDQEQFDALISNYLEEENSP